MGPAPPRVGTSPRLRATAVSQRVSAPTYAVLSEAAARDLAEWRGTASHPVGKSSRLAREERGAPTRPAPHTPESGSPVSVALRGGGVPHQRYLDTPEVQPDISCAVAQQLAGCVPRGTGALGGEARGHGVVGLRQGEMTTTREDLLHLKRTLNKKTATGPTGLRLELGGAGRRRSGRHLTTP